MPKGHGAGRRERRASLPPKSREELEALYGQVWDVRELARDFTLTSIVGDTVVVRRRADEVVGRLTFQTGPTLYFDFRPDPGEG